MKKGDKRSILLMSFLLSTTLSCQVPEPVQKVVNQVKSLVGIKDNASQKKKKEKKKKDEKPAQEVLPQDTNLPQVPYEEAPLDPYSLPVEPYAVNRLVPEVGAPENFTPPNLTQDPYAAVTDPNLVTQPPVVETPVLPPLIADLETWGGKPTSLAVNSSHVMASFGRRLYLFNRQLNFLTSVITRASVQKVYLSTVTDGTLVFIHEDQHIFEIAKIDPTGKMAIIKSFQVDGNFDGPFEYEKLDPASNTLKKNLYLIVYFEDRIELLDLTNPEQISVLVQLGLTNVTQTFVYKNKAYLVAQNVLRIINLDQFIVHSSVPLNEPFKILGITRDQNTEFMVVQSLVMGQWKGYRLLALNESGGVADLGAQKDLGYEMTEARVCLGGTSICGWANNAFSVFDIRSQNLLSMPTPATDVKYFVEEASSLVLLTEFGINAYSLSVVIPTPGQAVPANPYAEGLGQVPQTNQPSLQSTPTGSFSLPSVITHLGLISSKDFFAIAGSLGGDQILAGDRLNNEALPAFIKFPSSNTKIDLVQWTRLGYLLFDRTSGKIFLYDFTGKKLINVDIPALNIVDFDLFSVGTKNYLLVLVNKEGATDNGLVLWELDANHKGKKLSSLTLPSSISFELMSAGKAALVACGEKGICKVDLLSKRPKMVSLPPLPVAQDAIAKEIRLSPLLDRAYVYAIRENNAAVVVFDLRKEKPTEIFSFPVEGVEPNHFRNLSYSAGGNQLLLPSMKGLQVFDVSQNKAALLGTWGSPLTVATDVADQGRLICIASKADGLSCGQFNP